MKKELSRILPIHYIDRPCINDMKYILKQYRYDDIPHYFKRMIEAFWADYYFIQGVEFATRKMPTGSDPYNDVAIFCNTVMTKTINEQWIGNINSYIAGGQEDNAKFIIDSLAGKGMDFLEFMDYARKTFKEQECLASWLQDFYKKGD